MVVGPAGGRTVRGAGWLARLRAWWSPTVEPASAGAAPRALPSDWTAPWDAQVLSRVRRLHLRARVVTDSLLMGNHRSLRTGQAVEFADYQEYAPGMDLRGIDWKAWARTDRYMVRRYQTETELPCTVVLDLSGDASTGDAGVGVLPALEGTKAGAAITLAATLLYWFHRQSEPVGLRVVGGEAPFRDLAARRGRGQLQQAFLSLAAAKPGGTADLARTLAEVGGRTRRRSLVVVISDGMEEPTAWLPALAAFARRTTDIRFVHLYDPRELRLELNEASLLYSPEGGEALAVDPGGARREFAEVVRSYLEEVRAGVVRVGGQYVPMPTDRPLEEVVRAIVHGRVLDVVPP